jgi:hypothetical protein
MTIRNVPDTSDQKCEGGCISWLAHWERATGRSAANCLVSGCRNKADVGGHVREVGQLKVYIIPMCKQHNASIEPMNIDDTQRSNMVDAGVLGTCGPDESLADLLRL